MPTTIEAHTTQLAAHARPFHHPPVFDAAPDRAEHDFLVLNQRPDLTLEFFPPPAWAAPELRHAG